jgi:CRISPR-associated protein Csh1
VRFLIGSLYNLGRFVVEHEDLSEIAVFQDTAKLKNRTKRVLTINLRNINGNFVYDGIIEEELRQKDINKYLYKGGTPNGVDYTPSSLITSKAGSTFKGRVLKWFKSHRDPEFLDKIFDGLSESKDQIISDLEEKFSSIDKKNRNNVLLTITLQNESERKYVGDYQIFKEILSEESVKRYHNLKTIGESSGEGTCYLCDEDTEVYGFVPNAFGFSFSTADKKGNVPNFVQADQWKQVPICEDCAVFLEAGKKFVQEYLSFNLFTLKFFVIPNFLFKGDSEEFEEFYDSVIDFKGKKYEEGLVGEEDTLYSIVKDLDDILEFKFLFYELKGGGKFLDILNNVESILPSWMKKIYSTQKAVEKDILFKEDNLKLNFGKNVEGNFVNLRNRQSKGYINQYNWYAGFLRDFFPSNHNKYFLDIIGFIVGGKSLNKGFLISKFMDKIRKAHRIEPENDYSVKLLTTEAMMLYMFFNELELLKGVDKMKIGSHEEEDNEKDFFEVYGEFIDTPDKKASFLMGLLTKKLTAIQYNALSATPFMTKLWGLSLDQKKIQKLYPMLINKLREYKAAYPDLEELTSINLIKSNKNWKLSGDEASFYFVLGFTLNGIFKSKKEGVKNEQV